MNRKMHLPIENRTLTRKEILLVEDNAEDEKLTRGALRKGNILNRVLVAHDGPEASAHLFHQTGLDPGAFESEALPAVVFLDLDLTDSSGLELLRRIRLNRRTRRLPVVVMSSSPGDPEARQVDVPGASSYLCKPVDFEKLIHALHDLGMHWVLSNEPRTRCEPMAELMP